MNFRLAPPTQPNLFVVRFSTTRDPISWVIRRRTDFYVSHVEFELVQPYQNYGRGWTLGSRFPDGVKWRPPEDNKAQRNVVRVVRPGTDEAALWLAANRIGYRYGMPEIFGIAVGDLNWRDTKKRICSEAVTESFEQGANEFWFDPTIPCSCLTPRDVLIVNGWSRV